MNERKGLNVRIRRSMRRYLEHGNNPNTRHIIRIFSEAYGQPKQRICGNLSAMSGCLATHVIISNRPNSTIIPR